MDARPIASTNTRSAFASALNRTPQRDVLPDTVYDADRCTAAATVAAAVTAGPARVLSLIRGLREARGTSVNLGAQPMARLDSIAREVAAGKISAASIQRLQDYLFSVGYDASRPTSRGSGRAQHVQHAIAGFETRHFALPAGPSERGLARIAPLREELRPGEAMPVHLLGDNPQRMVAGYPVGHVVLLGRDARGQEFIYDSESPRQVLRSPRDAKRIDALLSYAIETHGTQILSLR